MTWAETHLACGNCGSSDAKSIDTSGSSFCFSCEDFISAEGDSEPKTVSKEHSELVLGGTHSGISKRRIKQETCEFFDVKIANDQFVFPYYDANGSLVAQKCRPTKEKMFFWNGSVRDITLFGQNKFTGGQTITIVEGEFDAMAFRELSGDYPVVSVANGAGGGPKDIRKNLEYFKNFRKVYICMDNDKPGHEAAQKIAELFPIGKVKIVHLRHFKDAGEYLENGKGKEFVKCWWDAAEYTPAGIEAGTEGGFDSLFEDIDGLELFPYPYDGLNESTFGIRKGEMVTVVAGSGTGKSAFVSEVAYKILMETKSKVGMLMLEESPKKTKLRLMSLFLNKPLHLTLLGRVASKFGFLEKVLDKLFQNSQDWEFTEGTRKELKHAWENVIERKVGEGDNQLWLFSHFGSNNIDTIVNRIDAMVTGLGCEFVFLDHISIVVSEQQHGDERKALDELATKLRTLVERRNFALIMVSHLRRPGGKPHEEGGETSLSDIRGTAGIGQLSDIVIGLERNGQHEDEFLRNVTKFRVLKNRFAGFTGLAGAGEYDIETGRLLEVDLKTVEALEKEHKGEDTNEFVPVKDGPIFDETPVGEAIANEREEHV